MAKEWQQNKRDVLAQAFQDALNALQEARQRVQDKGSSDAHAPMNLAACRFIATDIADWQATFD
eukprot:11164923-Lingulodinium_polyedra.AAC.1